MYPAFQVQAPVSPTMMTVNCPYCTLLLSYPVGVSLIRCSACDQVSQLTVMQRLTCRCAQCHTLLHYLPHYAIIACPTCGCQMRPPPPPQQHGPIPSIPIQQHPIMPSPQQIRPLAQQSVAPQPQQLQPSPPQAQYRPQSAPNYGPTIAVLPPHVTPGGPSPVNNQQQPPGPKAIDEKKDQPKNSAIPPSSSSSYSSYSSSSSPSAHSSNVDKVTTSFSSLSVGSDPPPGDYSSVSSEQFSLPSSAYSINNKPSAQAKPKSPDGTSNNTSHTSWTSRLPSILTSNYNKNPESNTAPLNPVTSASSSASASSSTSSSSAASPSSASSSSAATQKKSSIFSLRPSTVENQPLVFDHSADSEAPYLLVEEARDDHKSNPTSTQRKSIDNTSNGNTYNSRDLYRLDEYE